MGLSMKLSVSSKLADHITKDVILTEATPSKFISTFIALIVLSLLGFFSWASFSNLSITSVGSGTVLPYSPVQSVQHLDGGRIMAIHVEEGAKVNKGDLLVTLDKTEQQADYQAAWGRYGSALSRYEALRAFMYDGNMRKGEIPSDFSDMALTQEQVLSTMRGEISQIEAQIKWMSEVADIRGELADQKLGTKTQALESQSNLIQLKNDLLRIRRNAMRDWQAAKVELSDATQSLNKVRAKQELIKIYANEDSVVQEIKFKSPGSVVTSASVIMSLVPVGDPFKAEVKISPSDIGFVREGQKVRIKLQSYDYVRFGSLSGEVKHVLPGVFNDEHGAPFHKVVVEFHESHLKNQPDKKLAAGMQFQADIITDQQTVARYLFRPVFVAFDQGLRER
jgi:multidrug efflux pump subunit AcrA (membrane-fusion protein)